MKIVVILLSLFFVFSAVATDETLRSVNHIAHEINTSKPENDLWSLINSFYLLCKQVPVHGDSAPYFKVSNYLDKEKDSELVQSFKSACLNAQKMNAEYAFKLLLCKDKVKADEHKVKAKEHIDRAMYFLNLLRENGFPLADSHLDELEKMKCDNCTTINLIKNGCPGTLDPDDSDDEN